MTPDLLIIVPTAVFLMFGTRKDVWQAWCFWRKPRSFADEPLSIRVTLERGTDSMTEGAMVPSSESEDRLSELNEKDRKMRRVVEVDDDRLEKGKGEKEKEGYDDVIVIGRGNMTMC